ncbi:DoxX [Legionella busanensis]|uniref:DoxX n=1 Tax=Legionella busanensis TaxID=190655 RepID=A0A378JHW3_9GAMM|nr:DoxX family protein [Legionella busanensis]STX50906.1 DoxX [Legionella busanensis]
MEPTLFQDIFSTIASPWVIFIRLGIGFVFFPEGIQKLIFPELFGRGWFKNLGIPYPNILGPLVGWLELVCGVLILLGLFTRIACIPLIILMIIALLTTKMPIWFNGQWGPFQVREVNRYGFWSMLHEARSDWAMLMGCCYLLIVGAGSWSIDAYLN